MYYEPPYLTPSTEEIDHFYNYIESHADAFKLSPFLLIKGTEQETPIREDIKIANYSTYDSSSIPKYEGCYYAKHRPPEGLEIDFKIQPHTAKEKKVFTEEDFWETFPQRRRTKYANDVKVKFPETPFCNMKKIRSTLTELVPNASEFEGIGSSLAYLGSPGTYFTLHTEDYELCSVSYLHQGSPKIWYGFLAQDSERIIEFLKKVYPKPYSKCPQAHRHKSFFINPKNLQNYLPDLKIFKVTQPVGHYVVTGPSVFHQGFNSGHNIAEAVNLGIQSWVKYFKSATCCFCLEKSWKTNAPEVAALKSEEEEREQDNDISGHKYTLEGSKNKILDPGRYANTRTTSFLILTHYLSFDSLLAKIHKLNKANKKIRDKVNKEIEIVKKMREKKPQPPIEEENKTKNKSLATAFAIEQASKRHNYDIYSVAVFRCLNGNNRIISASSLYKNSKDTFHGCLILPYLEQAPKVYLEPTLRFADKFPNFLNVKYSDVCKVLNESGFSKTQSILHNFLFPNSFSSSNLPLCRGQPTLNNSKMMALAFCANHTSEIYCCLADSDGICLLRSQFSSAKTARQDFWNQRVLPLVIKRNLIVPSKNYLLNIFQISDSQIKKIKISEFITDNYNNSHIQEAIFTKLTTCFPNLEADKIKVEDLARLQILFYKKQLSTLDLNYLTILSSAKPSNIYALSFIQTQDRFRFCVVDEVGQSRGFMKKYENTKQIINQEVGIFLENLLLNKDDRLICSDSLISVLNPKPKLIFIDGCEDDDTHDIVDSNAMILRARKLLSKFKEKEELIEMELEEEEEEEEDEEEEEEFHEKPQKRFKKNPLICIKK